MKKKYNQVELTMQCRNHYDAYYKENYIGYVQFIHHYIIVEYKDRVVYCKSITDEDCLTADELKKYLRKAKKAIYKALIKDERRKEN